MRSMKTLLCEEFKGGYEEAPTTPYTKSKSPTANDIIEWVNERMEIDGSMKLFL